MIKKSFFWLLLVAVGLMLLFYCFGAENVKYSITVNGEPVHGFSGAAYAAGGLLAAGLAVVVGLALVVLILAGTSMLMLGVFSLFFLGLLLVFFPVFAPVAVVAIVIALVARKRKNASSQAGGKPGQ